MSEEKNKTEKKLRNLEPFKEGYDPRRGHRPKNTPNRSTLIKSVLGMKAKPPEDILKTLEEMYPKFVKKKTKKWTTQFLMTVRMAQEAMVKGDVRAFETLMNYAYGKEMDKVDLTSGGKPLPLLSNLKNDSNNSNKENTETPEED